MPPEPQPTATVARTDQEAMTAAAPHKPARPVGRATQEIDYGRRGKGYIFGAFTPADGEALTTPYAGRTTANWVDFLAQVEAWLPPTIERVYAIMDNLSAHRATDVLLFSLAHPLKGRRFETWLEVCQAVQEATAYWNAHRHPFIWGRRRRHHSRRRPGISLLPKVA